MQIPTLNGIYTDNTPELRVSYPVNLEPVPKQSGISNGFLKPSMGIVSNGTGAGIGRGGILWNDVLHRVMGTKLVSISSSGVVNILGEVGGTSVDLVSMTYSFDRLAIASNGNLFYWDGAGLVQVTDPDLGTVLDVVWVDGYFVTTDGENIVVTELNDPIQVNPLKYGSSEVKPDPIVALKILDNEVVALNKYTIEFFTNVGGALFPFQRIDGAHIQKGCVGKNACCIYMDSLAFVGSGENEEPSVYIGRNGGVQKISTDEIDKILSTYSESVLSLVKIETRNDGSHMLLYIHLPDRALVYDAGASREVDAPVWFVLSSSIAGFTRYRARDFVWAYNRWNVSDTDTASIGYLSNDTGKHWGDDVRWEFGTSILYNESNGLIIHELELVALTGRVENGVNPVISTSYSLDGVTWSQDKYINAGLIGDRKKRLVWFRQGSMRHWRIQRFRGDTQARLSFVRLEANVEALAA